MTSISDPTTSQDALITFDENAISEISYASYLDGGTISSAEKVLLSWNGTSSNFYDFTVTLNDGYEISAVDIDGTEIELTSENTFTITADILDSCLGNGDYFTITITTAKTDDTTSGGGRI